MMEENETCSTMTTPEFDTPHIRPVEVCKVCGSPTSIRLEINGLGERVIEVECECARSVAEARRKEHAIHERKIALARLRKSWGMEEFPVCRQNFESWDHENQQAMEDVFWKVRTFAANFRRNGSRVGLLLIGLNGTGKSHLLNAVAHYVSNTHLVSAISLEAVEILDRLRPNRSEEARDADWYQLRNVELLCLNDLGAIHATPWAVEKLYQLLTARNGRCTCASMNENPYTWAERGGASIERIRSRLEEGMDWIRVPAQAHDYRHIQRRMRAEEDGLTVPR